MKKIALLGPVALAACASLAGDGEQIGVQNGKAVYQSTCTVDLSTAGKEGLFGTGTIPMNGNCEIAAANRCGDAGFSIQDVDKSNFRTLTETIQTGTMIQRRSYPAVDTVMRFICNG